MSASAIYLIVSAALFGLYLLRCILRAGWHGSHKEVLSYVSLQPISVIIACYNEEAYICRRLESLMAEEDWIQGSEIIVISSGCTDNTNFILKHFQHYPFIKIVTPEERWTKIKSINYAVELARHDLLLFSDCRQTVKAGSVKRLVRRFTHEDIAVVGARLKDNHGNRLCSIPRQLINFISLCESVAGCSVNLHGALYAQRKKCFIPIPEDIIFDDLFVVASTMAQQKRVIHEPRAIIYDIAFERYYSRERIERLVRGLLLFTDNHFELIRKMPVGRRISFLLFKYFKLALPVWTAALISSLFYDCTFLTWQCASLMGTVLISFLSIRKMRRALLVLLHINVFFAWEAFSYYFRNHRSVDWKKLIVSKS